LRGGQIGPQLEAMHGALSVTFGHFLMDDTATGSHPLHVPRGYDTLVAQAVPVFNITLQDIRDRLNPTVGMPWKTFKEMLGVVGTKIIEHQKWIELRQFSKTEYSFKMNTGTLDDRLALEDLTDFSSFAHGNIPNFR
jgi:hypothetical protein